MTLIQIIVLAVVQGITEFLPISSSGHLVLVPAFLGWTDQGLIFDVAVHFGSLAAVCVYFRRDLASLLHGGVQVLRGNARSTEARLALGLAIATVPAAIAGLLFADWIEMNLRHPYVLVMTLSLFGILMALADRYGRQQRAMSDVRLTDALLIGLAQAVALIPGTSRSGITMTAGLALGLNRPDAARFSFLMSTPVILLAGAYKVLSVIFEGTPIAWNELALGVVISGIVAYFTIGFFMRFVNARGLLPFAIYRVVLAAIIYVTLV